MPERKPKFQKLTPIRDAEIGIYSEALDFVFENNDLRNIAISGAYSAGKSSVLESYKAAHPAKKFLHISLAHFQAVGDIFNPKDSVTENTPKPEVVKESVLEGKILNQLIHQIAPSRIPQTNFRVKQKISSMKLIWWITEIVLFISSLIHILFFTDWQGYVTSISRPWVKDILSLTIGNGSLFISGAMCVALAAVLLYHILKAQLNKGIFKKISADKFTIEIFEGSDDSYFDKYLNEVLYLFNQCEADVVVFEDMDRYNTNRIFERLREVNSLINVQRSKETNVKPLRFFYLLRDDIFVSKDRTKFFDFIIPVVPVVDGSNSYDQFAKHLGDSGTLKLFDESFLRGLSLYIDDMRILKNICNEFLVYDSRLNITELNPNKLMAIIAYKNLFPRDFSDLQLGRGFVFTLFDQKEQFIEAKIAQLDADLEVAKERLEAAKKEHLTSQQELGVVMQNKQDAVRKLHPYDSRKQEEQYGLFAKEEKARKEAIDALSGGRLSILETDIQHIESAIARAKSEALQDIITRENVDELFAVTSINDIGVVLDFKDVRGNDYFPLLKYLVRNGYIDESYADYMAYFYEHSLSRIDKIFLRSVSDQVKKEPGYQLKEPQKVLAHLDISVFDKPEVLNYDLLFFLLQKCAVNEQTTQYPENIPIFPTIKADRTKEGQCLMAMVEQILSTKTNAFLQSALADMPGERLNYLVNLLNSVRKDYVIDIILHKVEFARDYRNAFVLRTLIVTPDHDLTSDEDFAQALSAFVSSHPRLFDKESVGEIKMKTIFGANTQQERLLVSFVNRFKLLGIRFCSIDYDTTDEELFGAIYANNLYELSFPNISHLLKAKYGLLVSDDFKHKNYTLIKAQPDSPLTAYVESSIDDYVGEILECCDGWIEDNEDDVLALLNNEEVSAEHKSAYIAVLKTVIGALSSVMNQALWEQLITSNLVGHTEENVFDYFIQCSNTFTDDLVRFIDADK
ncbi:MAG: hypothetical protein VB099_20600, partial [Candidatus Limiplasma sp.]|nr:hypothetical protein [Candidatus Limiplasma sp.]